MEESASDGASESAANDAVPCPYAADPMANSIVGIANALRMLHPWFQRGNDLWTVLPDEARVHARSFRGRRGPLVAFRKALAPASCARVARARLSTIVKGSARQFIRTIGPTLRAHRPRRRAARGLVNQSEFGIASGSGNYAYEETDNARSLRTKHGPLGCRAGIALARGRFHRVLNDSHFVFPQDVLPPDSRAVRALSGVTVRCPFLHERMSPTRRVRLLPSAPVALSRCDHHFGRSRLAPSKLRS